MSEVESFDAVMEKYIPEEERKKFQGWIYGYNQGKLVPELPINDEATQLAEKYDFEVKAYKFNAAPEQLREPRVVRIGLIQHMHPCETTLPVEEQYRAVEARMEKICEAAGAMGVNVLCLQEAWHLPFFFATREKTPWCEFAAEAETGLPTQFCQRIARKYNMVVVNPILERDGVHADTIWNTAVIVGNNGNYIGKHRKHHIPRVGDFNESTYYMEGNTGHPVFDTKYGKIGVNICYGRHHPLNWMAFGLNGAEMVFNPSATVGALSEPMWSIEGRNAAIANNFFVGSINRVGTETYANEWTSGDGKPAHKQFGHFYGSAYMAGPDASRCPGLSRTRDGLHISEVDLNLCRQVKDKWCFQMTARHKDYAKFLTDYSAHDYEPQIIRDPQL